MVCPVRRFICCPHIRVWRGGSEFRGQTSKGPSGGEGLFWVGKVGVDCGMCGIEVAAGSIAGVVLSLILHVWAHYNNK